MWKSAPMGILRDYLWLWVILGMLFVSIVISVVFILISKCISRRGKHRISQLQKRPVLPIDSNKYQETNFGNLCPPSTPPLPPRTQFLTAVAQSYENLAETNEQALPDYEQDVHDYEEALPENEQDAHDYEQQDVHDYEQQDVHDYEEALPENEQDAHDDEQQDVHDYEQDAHDCEQDSNDYEDVTEEQPMNMKVETEEVFPPPPPPQYMDPDPEEDNVSTDDYDDIGGDDESHDEDYDDIG